MSGPLVSVIVAVHNGTPYLREAIRSILDQSYPWIEPIVVDDGSEDGTGEVLAHFDGHIETLQQARAGQNAARNAGIARSRGELLSFLDADDLYRPSKIQAQVAALEADPSPAAAFCHVREFLTPELDLDLVRRLRPPTDRISGRLMSCVLIRREALLRLLPLTTGLRVGNDLDWYSRFVEAGFTEVMLEDVLVERRLHQNNVGLKEKDKSDYLRAIKWSLDRRRDRRVPPEPTTSSREEDA